MTLPVLTQLAESLQASPLGTTIAESRYAFPVIEGIHLIGLSAAIGLLFVTDLRLAGIILKEVPASRVLHALRPWVLSGFAAILLSGALLFVAEAPAMVGNPAFAFKLAFIALAGLNAAYFELVIVRRRGAPAPAVRFAALASVALWTLVIACGRLIPYLPG